MIIYLDENWYEGFKEFGNDWDICMNVILNSDGSRFRDWCAWNDPQINWPGGGAPKTSGNAGHCIMLPPYGYNRYEFMYISGTYWIAKKHVMKDEPLDESIGWAEPPGEDLEWSKRVLVKYKYKMNTLSAVHSLKNKKLSAIEMTGDWINKLVKRFGLTKKI